MITINTEYTRKNEGYYYGEGSATLAERVARAVYGKKSAKGQAEAALRVIKQTAADWGFNPDIECFARKEQGQWRVSWESGPYQWAIPASDALFQVGILAEPYYSFDLCFYGEDA